MSAIDIIGSIVAIIFLFVLLALFHYACFKHFCSWADSLPGEERKKAYKDYLEALLDNDRNQTI